MVEPSSPMPEVLQKLQLVDTGSDVVRIIGDASVAKILGQHPKEPAVRRAMMLLASGDPDLPLEERAKRIATLALLWSVKPLRTQVNELAPRALAEPMPDVSSMLPLHDRTAIAAWLSGTKMAWIVDFAAKSAIAESGEARLCQAHVMLLLGRAPNIAFALHKLNDEIASVDVARRPTEPARIVNLCAALAHSVVKTSIPLGKNFLKVFLDFAMGRLRQGSEIIPQGVRSQIGLGVAELIVALAQQSPSLLLSKPLFEIVGTLDENWIAAEEKKWARIKKTLVDQMGHLVTLFSVSGVLTPELAQRARLLETSKGSFDRLCRKILEENDISSEEVAAWLLRGEQDDARQKARTQEPRNEIEALATVMLRADELASIASNESLAHRNSLLEALLSEINQMAARKGLRLDGQRNSTVTYDSLRQRCVGSVGLDAKVRILVPGVIRKSDRGEFQIVQAVVQPIDLAARQDS